MKPDRTVLIIFLVIVVLIAGAVSIISLRGEPTMLDASTPAGTVQRYSAAVMTGDAERAADYLADVSGDNCYQVEPAATNDVRIVLVSTTERADSAQVTVSIVTYFNSGPFGDSYEEEAVFNLVKVAGEWLVASAPWQLTMCPDAAILK